MPKPETSPRFFEPVVAAPSPRRTKKVCVVMPAYNAEKTLERTWQDLPKDWVDDVILVDDASRDRTVELAQSIGLHVLVHPKNRG